MIRLVFLSFSLNFSIEQWIVLDEIIYKEVISTHYIVIQGFDQIFLLPIYPAREAPIEGVDSFVLMQKIKNNNKRIINSANVDF